MTAARAARVRVYCTERWKRLRRAYLMEHPLCERCEREGRVTMAVDVHHRDSFMRYEGEMREWKAFDANNLEALCKECHAREHRGGGNAE